MNTIGDNRMIILFLPYGQGFASVVWCLPTKGKGDGGKR